MTESVYPPVRHLLRDLGVTGERGPGRAVNTMALRPGLADRAGGLRLGAIAALLDTTGAGIALATVAPDWIATADLSCHLLADVDDAASVTCRPLRVGSSTVVVGAEIHDGHGRPRGTGRMAFARIPGAATRAQAKFADPDETVAFSIDGGSPIDESVLDRCGVRAEAAGRLVMEKSPYVENSFGTINGGVMALLADAAAVSAVDAGRALDLQIHYLEQIRSGPVEAIAAVVREGPAVLCEVRLTDRGDGRLMAIADVAVG